MYNNTLIEPTGKLLENGEEEYRVVAQDGPLPAPIYYGTKEECDLWRGENCAS